MKMDSSPIVVTSPLLVDASLSESTGPNPVSQAIAALGDPESPSELAQRLAVVVAMLWPQIADADLFLPEKGRPLRGVRDARAGAGLLATLNAVWGSIAARGSDAGDADAPPGRRRHGARFDHVDADLLWQVAGGIPGRATAGRRSRVHHRRPRRSRPRWAKGWAAFFLAARAHVSPATTSWLEQDLAAAGTVQRTFLPEPIGDNSAGVRVVTEYMPAYAVGGDFYDFIDLGNGRVMGVIGDVSGQGRHRGADHGARQRRHPPAGHRGLGARGAARAPEPHALGAHAGRPLRDGALRAARRAEQEMDLRQRRPRAPAACAARPAWCRASPTRRGRRSASWRTRSTARRRSPSPPSDILLLATDGVFEILSAPRRPCSTMGQCQFTELVGSAPHDVGEISRRIVATAHEATRHGRDDLALLGLQIAG